MNLFRRSLRWLLAIAGFTLGLAGAVSAIMARMMIAPPRQHVQKTAQSRELSVEDVQFPALDGLRVSGWFVPALKEYAENAPTIVLLHGWQWNRLGYDARDLLSNLTGSKPIQLLPLIAHLREAGNNVLAVDLRNHGESATAYPVTFGRSEAKDLLGALAYLQSREDVDSERIGAMGFSMGANAILFALPQTNQVRAVFLAQPMTPALFARRASRDLFGIFGWLIGTTSALFYRLFSGQRLEGIVPAFAAGGSGDVPAFYLQGTGDEWGSVEDVSVMADRTPATQRLLFVNSQHRFDGYTYVLDHPALAAGFFKEHLG